MGHPPSEDIPPHAYYDYFLPDHRLNLRSHRAMDNNNLRADVERIKREVLESLRHLTHAPGPCPSNADLPDSVGKDGQ